MFIYKITNIKNNKVYIGQTIKPIEQRFKRHINDALNNILDTHFAMAIRKYGESCFRVELIDTAITQEELNIKVTNMNNNEVLYFNSIRKLCKRLKISRNHIRMGKDILFGSYRIEFK